MQYIPGISFGNITFGMSVQEVNSIMGPDGILEPSDSGDMQLIYESDGLSFLFAQEEELLLSSILVERGHVPLEFSGNNIFELPFSELLELLNSLADETDHSYEVFDDIGEVENIEFESLGLSLYFDITKLLLEVTLFELTEERDDDEEENEDDDFE